MSGEDADLLGMAALRKRGWTPGLVRRFLGEQDKLAQNPHYRSAAPVRLYFLARVVAAESTPGFAVAKTRAEKQSRNSKTLAQHRRDQLLREIAELKVVVRKIEPAALLCCAIAHYNSRLHERDRGESTPASEASDKAFLDRIQVNYVRHELTAYDRTLEATAGRVGVAEAIDAIREKVYDAISEAYEELSSECERQFLERLAL